MQLFRTALFQMNVILIGTLFVVVHCACKSKGGKKTTTTQKLPLQKLITTQKGTGYSYSNATKIQPKQSLTPIRTKFQDCSRCPTPSPVKCPGPSPCPSCPSRPVYPTCSPCPECPGIPTPSPYTICPIPPTPTPCQGCPLCHTCAPCQGVLTPSPCTVCPDPPTPTPQALPIEMKPIGPESEDDLSEDDADCDYDSGAEHFKISYLNLFVIYGILSTMHSCIIT